MTPAEPSDYFPATYLPAIVIGAGISGLTCAYTLRQRGLDAHLFEASGEAGGVIRSEHRNDFLLELGPQSFTFSESLQKLSRELRIEDQIAAALAKLPRSLYLDRQLAPAPLNPLAFFTSPLFSARTKWSVLRDTFGNTKPPNPTAAGDESIAQFIRRKFSGELLDKLVGPFVSGIYAGDPEKLGLRSAFPQLYAAENSSGSVIRGMFRASRKSRASRTLATFAQGNATLTRALAARLGTALHMKMPAARITLAPSHQPGRFVVEFRNPDSAALSARAIRADHVILATPSDAAAKLIEPLDPSMARLLDAIQYAPISVVSLGYRQAAVRNQLHGFGFLVPRSSGLRILGCVWNSSLFPGRAPEGSVLLTSFVGGVSDPAATKLPAQELQAIAHQELSRILDISEPPSIANVQIWPRAIPQYDLAHYQRAQSLNQKIAAFPGLALAGNYLDGPAVGAVVDRARKLADYVLDGPLR
jgi:oxygen-dependent protoporphyrinogen oxidase